MSWILAFHQQTESKIKYVFSNDKNDYTDLAKGFCLSYDPIVWILVLDLHSALPQYVGKCKEFFARQPLAHTDHVIWNRKS